MNKKQKIIIAVAIVFIILTFLYVPYRLVTNGCVLEYRYDLIFTPQICKEDKRILLQHNLEPAVFQMLTITLITVGLVFVFKSDKG